MRPRPREAAASDTKCPLTVLSPPAPLLNVTSVEKVTSSSTRPHLVQHLRRTAAELNHSKSSP